MAAPQQYSLRWNNYLRHLTYALDNHRNNDDFVDVSLLCDGRKIKAHKVVLSACSSYFKEIFIENPHPHPVIIFKFIKYEDLNSIIEFMYQGEVNVQQEALQSFLQTAELLAVQGLTSEEKEKPKPPSPIIDDHKLVKTIPSTIRAVNDNTAATQTTLEISTNNILQASTQQLQVTQQLPQPQQHHVQTQIHPIQMQQQQQQQQPPTQCNPTISQHAHQQQVNVTAPHHTLQQIQQVTQHSATQSPTQSIQVNTQNQIGTTGIVTMPVSHGNTMKKRKLTFADDDDNIYTAESVDYGIKDEQNIVKTADVTLLRGTIKMDIPEYIISDDRLTDEDVSQGHNADTSQNVTTQQYTSTEYEILTESEIEEKYHQQVESDNNEITIEMGRLLNTATASTATAAQHALDDSPNLNNTNAGNTTTLKNENKTNSTTGAAGTDLPNNKWTECQFCKMVITTVNLWRHIRTQHTPQPPRKCDFCNKNFKNKYSLREHIRISHEQKLALKSEN